MQNLGEFMIINLAMMINEKVRHKVYILYDST